MMIAWEGVRSRWENVRSSLWFIPSLLMLVAGIGSVLIPELDHQIADDLTTERRWLFSGSPSAARTILSVIAGSLITVISLLFSITVLTLQQASTQFTPRVIRTFTRDQGSQLVLGVYVATFLYALLVLRQVRGEVAAAGEFVPVIAVTVAIMLAILCLGCLIYFIHHSATLFQAATVIERVHHDLLAAIDRLYPSAIGKAVDDGDAVDLVSFRHKHALGMGQVVPAPCAGFLRSIDEQALAGALPAGSWAIVDLPVGSYLLHGQPLVEIGSVPDGNADIGERLTQAFVIDQERTITQDALFGIRQLVDIALKALSPAISDPTTAEHAIGCLGNALMQLATRPFPSPERIVERGDEGSVTIWLARPTFEDYVEEALGQIERAAREEFHVLRQLKAILVTVARHTEGTRSFVLGRHIERVTSMIEHAPDFT